MNNVGFSHNYLKDFLALAAGHAVVLFGKARESAYAYNTFLKPYGIKVYGQIQLDCSERAEYAFRKLTWEEMSNKAANVLFLVTEENLFLAEKCLTHRGVDMYYSSLLFYERYTYSCNTNVAYIHLND